MSNIKTSVCKLCRRENAKLFLKGERCFTDKCAFERRPYPPGQHGQARLKFSEYALQLREKQKTKRYYGLGEKQFRRYFHDADMSKGVTGDELLRLLETRLDSVVCSMGFASSRRDARQIVKHNHVLVNGKCVNIANFHVGKGDTVEIREKSRALARIMAAVENSKRRTSPDWIEADHANFKGTIKELPMRDHVGLEIEENMIVEYYSR